MKNQPEMLNLKIQNQVVVHVEMDGEIPPEKSLIVSTCHHLKIVFEKRNMLNVMKGCRSASFSFIPP